MAEQNNLKEFTKGIFQYNPLFVLVLGICPSLAVTTSVKNGLAMGGAATFVLVCSNFIISIVRSYIPREIRIPCFIVVIAAFVTMVELLMKAYLPPELNASLGIFIPLIVVNCMIMAPGAFIVLGLLLGFFNWRKLGKSEKSMKAVMKDD